MPRDGDGRIHSMVEPLSADISLQGSAGFFCAASQQVEFGCLICRVSQTSAERGCNEIKHAL